MMEHVQKYDVQARNLEEMAILAQQAGGYLTVTRFGGLGLIPEEVIDGPVPGALIEGISTLNSDLTGFEDNVLITFWTDGAMHQIITDPRTETRVNVVVSEGMGSVFSLPDLELCGRCNRHIVPSDVEHVGC
jgi:hypothetical protein